MIKHRFTSELLGINNFGNSFDVIIGKTRRSDAWSMIKMTELHNDFCPTKRSNLMEDL